MLALIAPSLALGWTLIIVTVSTLLWLPGVLHAYAGMPRIRSLLFVALPLGVGAAAIPFLLPNVVAERMAFAEQAANATQRLHSAYERAGLPQPLIEPASTATVHVFEWLVRVQPVVYPLGVGLRAVPCWAVAAHSSTAAQPEDEPLRLQQGIASLVCAAALPASADKESTP